MSTRFFSNNLVLVDTKINESVKSLAGSRQSAQRVFSVPTHTIGTDNLMVYIDGLLKLRDVHYIDRNSNEIEFLYDIQAEQDFYALLIRVDDASSSGATTDDNNCCCNKWHDFADNINDCSREDDSWQSFDRSVNNDDDCSKEWHKF